MHDKRRFLKSSRPTSKNYELGGHHSAQGRTKLPRSPGAVSPWGCEDQERGHLKKEIQFCQSQKKLQHYNSFYNYFPKISLH